MPNSINPDSDADIQIWHNEKQLLDYIENHNQTKVYADPQLKENSGVKHHYHHKEFQTLCLIPAQYRFLLNNTHTQDAL